ncbi:MAG: hypothetical protein H6558_20130 [Lewinellaceae bacterium]|nr:hypothetical protein [Lewinellaceae bacterium]
MKHLLQACCTALFLTLVFPLYSSVRVKSPASGDVATEHFERHSGKKLTFVQKLALRYVQKKIRKHQKKSARARIKDSPDNLATFALVLGVLTYGLLAIQSVAFLSFFFAIGAVVAGILALKRRGNKLRSILGIVLGGVFFAVIFIGLIKFLLDPPGG